MNIGARHYISLPLNHEFIQVLQVKFFVMQWLS